MNRPRRLSAGRRRTATSSLRCRRRLGGPDARRGSEVEESVTLPLRHTPARTKETRRVLWRTALPQCREPQRREPQVLWPKKAGWLQGPRPSTIQVWIAFRASTPKDSKQQPDQQAANLRRYTQLSLTSSSPEFARISCTGCIPLAIFDLTPALVISTSLRAAASGRKRQSRLYCVRYRKIKSSMTASGQSRHFCAKIRCGGGLTLNSAAHSWHAADSSALPQLM